MNKLYLLTGTDNYQAAGLFSGGMVADYSVRVCVEENMVVLWLGPVEVRLSPTQAEDVGHHLITAGQKACRALEVSQPLLEGGYRQATLRGLSGAVKEGDKS
ncbi:hypothetical protein [Azotobacter chroococcum]|uniref:hypothetical protein n=1 Tax=Azotobacter chroococcum TaxID=353 RepID=UPI0010AEE7E5|nr:hypothetical protein [Azotobacter chroococcum]TKD46043.1 hypothetical protein FCG41_02865 [Azotobacter chroococcum]